MGKTPGRGGAESAVEERRLRPIYDLLDINSNKKAVQELDRLLKKQPHFLSAKVLKALALLRLGKTAECETIIATVVAPDVPAPTDENTIQALSICYRELNKPEAICELLERACQIEKSEDLLTHSFMAHVRTREFQKQHQIALSLFKLYPKVPYFSWSIMSLYAKAESVSDEQTIKLTLLLAERMMAKFIEDNKIDSDHEIHLYLLILRKQAKFDKLLELVDKFSERNLGSVTGFFQKMKIECLKATQKFEMLAQYLENLILENQDEWKYYEEYVKTCIKTQQDSGVQRVRKFLENQMSFLAAEDQKQKLRPVLLACFLSFQLIVDNNISTDWDILPLFKSYVEHFGQKPTFFIDIINFLGALLEKTSKDILLKTLRASSTESPVPLLTRDLVQRELNYTFLDQYLQESHNDSAAGYVQLVDFFETLVGRYLHSLDAKTPLDDFLIVGTITLADKFWSYNGSNDWTGFFKSRQLTSSVGAGPTRDADKENETGPTEVIGDGDGVDVKCHGSVPTPDGNDQTESEISNGLQSISLNNKPGCSVSDEDFPVLYCAAILNYGLFESMNNAHLRILLTKLFIRCGAVGAASETVRGLDLKHIQLESLGYLYIWKLIRCGLVNEGYRQLFLTEHFYVNYEKESMEHIISAYKYGSWEKVLEFSEFRLLLLGSAQFCIVTIEKQLLDHVKDLSSRSESLKAAVILKVELMKPNFLQTCHLLRDNRDLTVLTETGVRASPHLQDWREVTFKADLKQMKIRWCVLALINNCVLLMDDSTDEAAFANLATSIDSAREVLKEELVSVDDSLESQNIDSITGPWPPRILEYIKSGHPELVLKLSSLISALIKEPGNSEKLLVELLATIQEDFERMVNERISSWRNFQKRKHLLEFSQVLESGYDMIETISFMCVFFDVIAFVIQKNANRNAKSKKKKSKSSTAAVGVTHDVSHFMKLLTTTLESLEKIENELKSSTQILIQNFSTEWESLDSFWKQNVNGELYARIVSHSMPMILFKLSESYYLSLQEFSGMISLKTKYLESIRAQF